jgi:hypothetical protein
VDAWHLSLATNPLLPEPPRSAVGSDPSAQCQIAAKSIWQPDNLCGGAAILSIHVASQEFDPLGSP